MTQAEFARRVVAMQDTLYRVSTTILPQLCDREDAVQSAIEKALRKRDKLRDPAALEAWLTRILINECYLILRSRKRETPMDDLPERETAPVSGAEAVGLPPGCRWCSRGRRRSRWCPPLQGGRSAR